MYAVLFDMDTNCLEQQYEGSTHHNSYKLIKDFMLANDFTWKHGIIQKSNKITINTDMVTAKTKDKPATYDIQIEDYKYQLIITYQYSNIDKALEILKSKRFVYHDIGIAIMPEKAYIDTLHNKIIKAEAEKTEAEKRYSPKYLSPEFPDIRLSKENYVNYIRLIDKAFKTKSDTTKEKRLSSFIRYSIQSEYCPFYLNFKGSSVVEVQHYINIQNVLPHFFLFLYTYDNKINYNNEIINFKNHIDFNYTIEKLDNKKVIIRIDDKNLSELGKVPTSDKDYYTYDGPQIRYRYNNTTYSYRNIRTLGKEKVGHRLFGDHYTNILLDTETGIISYEIDIPAHYNSEYHKKQRAIIYLKAE